MRRGTIRWLGKAGGPTEEGCPEERDFSMAGKWIKIIRQETYINY
jgi:hypothetical protein